MDYDPTKPGPIKEPETFEQGLEALINRFSQENGSNTPDFILAQYLLGCLTVWNSTVTRRELWYGREMKRPEEASTKTMNELLGPGPRDIGWNDRPEG